MEEIKIENNIGLKVYVNGKIYIKEIPPPTSHDKMKQHVCSRTELVMILF